MSVTVSIPTPLRSFTAGQDSIELAGDTVGQILDGLMATHAGLKRHLLQDDGRLRNFVNLYLNETDIRHLESTATPVRPGDVLTIVPSIAGGAPVTQTEPQLSHAEVLRYSRHLLLPEVGIGGQRKLKAARVLTIGAGGLGSPLSLYLAAAGVGTIGIVDFDAVDLTNLQRQIVHGTSTLGRPKLESAEARLTDLNPNVRIEKHETRLSSQNAMEILREYDIVVDGTDNFPTRYLVNDACVLLGKPNVYGSIFRFEGQASVFYAKQGPCYRCLYSEPPPPGLVPSCAEGGVLGVLPGIIGSIQALETIKWIIGAGDSLIGRLVLFDALKLRFRELQLRKDPACPICGDTPSIHELIDYEAFCGIGAEPSYAGPEITAEELRRELDEKGSGLVLIDVREPHEWEIAHIEGAQLIPLSQLPERVGELDGHAEIVTHCHHGARSMKALGILKGAGFNRVRSLAGGIDAWADRVEVGMPRY
ncbi:MAG: sulfur-carrier protein adenylyltransferase/sulfurtransferase [Gemmatimonadales bacterium]|jgi:adenylyltransferase/sulfurtransferase|nr:sulfur-carrier protein adenylyltransferase/sulfurtransferase [Gemmatimonadales bacterium]